MSVNGVDGFFISMMIVPCWFTLYTVARFITHWEDGVERNHSVLSVRQVLKFLLVILLVCAYLYSAIENAQREDLMGTEWTIRCTNFTLNCLAWGLSYCLLVFEFNRKLPMSWKGHRSFWVVSSFGNSAKTGVDYFMSDLNYEESGRLILGACMTGVTMVLGVLAVFRPNDFYIRNINPIYDTPFNERASRIIRPPDNDYNHFFPIVSTTITDYKVKTINEKPVIHYIIVIRVDNERHTVIRTYPDFYSLHKILKEKFCSEGYPCLNLPGFPRLSHLVKVDDALQAINVYAEELCRREFLCEEVVDFFEIEGETKDKLLDENQKILRVHSVKRSVSSEIVSQTNNVILINVSILMHNEGTEAYEVSWKIISTQEEGGNTQKYNRFYELNQRLQKKLSPAVLPDFPTKYSLPVSRTIDFYSIEHRRSSLERYLSYILNDPAYLTQESLELLCIKTPLSSI